MKASVIALHWLPRIICMLGILFISKNAFDSIESYLTLPQQILIFLVHLVPSILVLALLIIAWKWELAGGILFTLFGLALTPVVFQNNYNINESILTSLGIVMMFAPPLLVTGSLFIVSFVKRRQYRMRLAKKAVKVNRIQSVERYKLVKFKTINVVKPQLENKKSEKRVLQPMEEY